MIFPLYGLNYRREKRGIYFETVERTVQKSYPPTTYNFNTIIAIIAIYKAKKFANHISNVPLANLQVSVLYSYEFQNFTGLVGLFTVQSVGSRTK